MGIQDKLKDNIVWWSLILLVIGFTSGIGAYKGMLDITKQETVVKGTYILNENKESNDINELSKLPFIKVNDIKFLNNTGKNVKGFRLIFDINGTFVSYPQKDVWLTTDFESQSLAALPIDYRVMENIIYVTPQMIVLTDEGIDYIEDKSNSGINTFRFIKEDIPIVRTEDFPYAFNKSFCAANIFISYSIIWK
jgi:hypothetical protein